jgi:DNA polymerase-3 subunit delta'
MQTAPRQQKQFIGHKAAEAALLHAAGSGRMPHAWLIVGEEGIGKATLAYRFARYMMANSQKSDTLSVSPDHPAMKLMMAGSHPDLLVLERNYDEKKRKLSQSIPVEDVRTIEPFLRLTSNQGTWRIVLIDGADYMNRNGQNVLLKILEEPPAHSLLLLTATNAASLLPTIRSRCRVLKLDPLSDDDLRALAEKEGLEDSASLDLLIKMAEGSAARLFRYANCDGHLLYKSWCDFLMKPENPMLRLRMAESWAGKDQDDVYATAQDIMFLWLQRVITAKATGQGVEPLMSEERPLKDKLYPQLRLDRLLGLWENLHEQTRQQEFSNLDRKVVFINMLDKTAEALAA